MTKKKITGINGLEIDSIPSGVVVSWYGDKVNVPSGWAICDGTNGTPDLRDRFIVGAGNSYSLNATGGANTVSLTINNLPKHNFTGTTNKTGKHTHTRGNMNITGDFFTDDSMYSKFFSGAFVYGKEYHGNDTIKGIDNSNGSLYGTAKFDASKSWTGETSEAGEHQHTFSTDSVGNNEAHENRPPYYALYFIMKL